MKMRLFLPVALSLLVSLPGLCGASPQQACGGASPQPCPAKAVLSPGGWEPSVRARLDALIERNRGNPDAYAVFDFDHTTAIGDLSYVCLWRILERLDLRMDSLEATLMQDLPERYAKEMATIARLADGLKPRAGEDLRNDPQWREMVTRFWKIYRIVYDDFGTHFACEWRMRLVKGYTPEAFARLAKEAIAENLAIGRLVRDVTVPREQRGMVFPPEMKNLFAELRKAGIAIYIVSGSVDVPLLAATGPDFGYDIEPSHVFGVKLERDAAGRYTAKPLLDGVKTGEKTTFILKYIAPRHHGKEPVLTAGDSIGDYTMLTEFKDLQVGLLFERNWREKPMHDLVAAALSGANRTIAVQGRDEARGCFIPSHHSICLPRGAK